MYDFFIKLSFLVILVIPIIMLFIGLHLVLVEELRKSTKIKEVEDIPPSIQHGRNTNMYNRPKLVQMYNKKHSYRNIK